MSAKRRYRLKELRLSRVDRVDTGANPGAHVVLFKSLAEIVDQKKETVMPEPTEAQKKAQAEAEATAAAEKAAEVAKAAAETVAKADFDALAKKNAELEAKVAKADALEEKVAKMEAAQRKATFIAKAEAEFNELGNSDEIGALLDAAEANLDEAQNATLEKLLKGANEQVAKGALFATFTRPGSDGPASWEAKLEELAKAKVAAGQARTIEIAKLDVMRENPELAAERAKSL